ncbi:MAG: diguanylate cyclase [Magnetococcales bacterium]|nr:diguanylate cyclase [Magnetococcales bacterium]
MNDAQSRKSGWFSGIRARILLITGLSILIGFGGMTLFYFHQDDAVILAQGKRTMGLLASGASAGLQTAMLSGNAQIAHDYVDNIKRVPNILDFQILRVDGRVAFRDNQTIDAVNAFLGGEHFTRRPEAVRAPAELSGIKASPIGAPSGPIGILTGPVGIPPGLLAELARTNQATFEFSTDADSEPILTVFQPIQNREECHGCHAKDSPLRGVIKMTTSLAAMKGEIHSARAQTLGVFGLGVFFILWLVYWAIHRLVVVPVGRITRAMEEVAGGDMTHQVPVLGSEEFVRMARSFNLMSAEVEKSHKGLQNERDKLTTIILSAREGIIVTDQTGRVVLVNPAAERLLGKSAQDISEEGFVGLLDDPGYMEGLLNSHDKVMPETVVYNSRVLQVYAATIRAVDGHPVGSAALLRDVTSEKRLEERLRQLSYTDGLTGLLNRRRLDEVLADEFDRAKRYHLELAVLLFDVDHFKKFNDRHGHDQGDRVLQAIGSEMRHLFRALDFPCRFGGEEFCVIMPNTGRTGALQVAERLRERVELMKVDALTVTISIGVATLPLLDVPTPEALLKAADEALYEAKQGGRNQVCNATPRIPRAESGTGS